MQLHCFPYMRRKKDATLTLLGIYILVEAISIIVTDDKISRASVWVLGGHLSSRVQIILYTYMRKRVHTGIRNPKQRWTTKTWNFSVYIYILFPLPTWSLAIFWSFSLRRCSNPSMTAWLNSDWILNVVITSLPLFYIYCMVCTCYVTWHGCCQ